MHRVLHSAFFGALTISFITGCSSDPRAVVGDVACSMRPDSMGPGNESGIIGGQRLADDSRIAQGTVFLLDRVGGGACTGVVIGDRAILTAAHCIGDLTRALGKYLPSYLDISVFFSNNVMCMVESGKSENLRTVIDFEVHSDYREKEAISNDLAVLKLDRSIPTFVKPFAVSDLKKSRAFEEQIYVAGYGKTQGIESDETDLFLRFKELSFIKELNSKFVSSLKLTNPKGFTNANFPLLLLGQEQGGACSGDSGGPGFSKIDGELVLEGIAAYVFDNSGVKANCHSASAYTSVRVYADWIRNAANKLNVDIFTNNTK